MKFYITILWILFAVSTFAQKDQRTQKVTLKLDDITLEEALTVIGISYHIDFSYSQDLVPLNTKVALDVSAQPLNDVLTSLLEPLQLEYKFIRNRVVIRSPSTKFVQTIRGIVLDESTQQPIPGVSVTVVASEKFGAITDEQGKFKIKSIPVGRITIEVGSIGYQSRIYNDYLLGTGKELVLDVWLSESITTMNEIIVTAAKTFTSAATESAITSSHAFTAEETQRFAGSLSDPARMATAFAGVTGASDDCNSLIVRGNSPRGVLWRVQGIEIPNPNHFTSEGSSSGVVSILSPNIVGKTTFLTGAFPSQYGNALSAVFDVSLREGNDEKREHSLQLGTLGIEASTEGPISRTSSASYLVNYRYSTLSLLDKFGFGLSDAAHYKDYQDVSFHVNVPSAKSNLNIFGIGGESVYDKNEDNIQDKNGSSMGVAGINYRYNVHSDLRIAGALSWSTTDISRHHEVSGLEAGPLRIRENYQKSYLRTSLSVDNQVTKKLALQSGVIGSFLNYDFYMINQDPGNPSYQTILNFSAQDKTATWQVYTSAKHQLHEKLSAYYGIHVLRFNLSKDVSVEPRLGLRWDYQKRSSINFAYGRHSRIENLQYYLARDHQPGGEEVQINQNLSFTRAHHVVLGHHYKVNDRHALKTELYYQRLEDVPVQANPSTLYASINEDTGFITDTLLNQGSGRNYGIEASLERTFSDHFYYMINGSYFQSLLSIDGQHENNTAYNGNYSFHLLGGKEFVVGQRNRHLSINLKMTGAGGRRYVPIDIGLSKLFKTQIYDWARAFDPKMPDYFRMDFQLAYRLSKPTWEIEFTLDIQNITDHRNASYYYYDARQETIKLKRQVGFLPLLACKVKF